MLQSEIPRPSGRAEQTRRRIMQAGAAAFARKDLAAVNLKRDILAPAAVSVGSFYHQFKDKRALLIAILEEQSAILRSRFSEVHRPDGGRSAEQVAHESYSLVFDTADRFSDAMRIQLRDRQESDPAIQAFIGQDRTLWQDSLAANFMAIAQARGLDLDVELAAELITALTQGALRYYLELSLEERSKTRERLVDGLVRLTLGGLPRLVRTP